MASQYISVKKYAGVCYVESKRHKFRGKPDRIFWVRFKDRNGKLKYEKCGRASEGWNPEAAQKKRFNILEQDRAGKYKPKDQRKKQSITLNTLFDDHYFPWAKINKKRPVDDESRYRNWLRDSIGSKPLYEIERKDLEDLMIVMAVAGKAQATIRQVIALTRYLYNQATEWNLYKGDNPCAKIKIKVDNARQRFLSKDEANLLLTELRKKSSQTAQIAELSLYTGMRRGEIFNLKWSDIDLEHNLITVLDTKNKESRKAFVTEPVKAIINGLTTSKPNNYLFTNAKGEKLNQLSRSFSRTVENLKFNAGIEDNRQRVSFHSLRHTFASWAVMEGVPLYHLAKALGHKTTAMTERYSHLAPDSQRLAFEAVANFKTGGNATNEESTC